LPDIIQAFILYLILLTNIANSLTKFERTIFSAIWVAYLKPTLILKLPRNHFYASLFKHSTNFILITIPYSLSLIFKFFFLLPIELLVFKNIQLGLHF